MNQLIVASAHKVGSTWLTAILRNYFDSKDHIVPTEFRLNEHIPGIIELNSVGVSAYLASLTGINVFKSHCKPPTENDPVWHPINVLNIHRDPRDMAVSNAFYLENLPPELGGWEKFSSMDVESRILRYLEDGLYDLELLESWFSNELVIKITYEDMLDNNYKCIVNALNHLDLPIDGRKLAVAINQFSFEKMTGGRSPGDQNHRSFYRKGISGDWLNYFNSSVKAKFKSCHNGRWNNMLVKLGYESTTHW